MKTNERTDDYLNPSCVTLKFMLKLGLRASERAVYAVIYFFTKGREGMFYGSRAYLAEATGYSEKTVSRALKALREHGYIKHPEGKPRAYVTVDSAVKGISTVKRTVRSESALQPAAAKKIPPKIKLPPLTDEEIEEIRLDVERRGKERMREAEERKAASASPSLTDLAGESNAAILAASNIIMNDKNGENISGNSREYLMKHDFFKKTEENADGRANNLIDEYEYADEDDEDEEDEFLEDYLKHYLPKDSPPPRFKVYGYGRDEYVTMTREQYRDLAALVDVETLSTYIAVLNRKISKGVPRPHSCYRALKKWITEDFSVQK